MSHLGASLSAYLDGEADAAEAGRVVEHLAWCDACRSEMESVLTARRAVRSLPMLELPAVVGLGPAPRRTRLRAVVGAAAAIAVLVAAISLGSPETVPVEELVVPHVELARVGAIEVAP